MNAAIMQYRKKNKTGVSHSDTVREVRADIIFGMPSKNCDNYGICKISRSQEGPGQSAIANCIPCQQYRASAILLLTENNELEMRCLADTISDVTRKRHFNSDVFHVMEDYSCTDDICQRLDTNELVIKKGKYNVQQSEDYLTILFH